MNRLILALALLAMGTSVRAQDIYDPFGTGKKSEPAKTATPTTATKTEAAAPKTDIYDPFGTGKATPTTATKTDDKTPKKDPGSPTFDDGLESTIGSYAAWGQSGGGYGYGRSYGTAGRTNGYSSYSHSSVGRTHMAGTHGGSFRTNGYHSGGSWAGYTPPSYRPYTSAYSSYSAYRPAVSTYGYANTYPSYGTYAYSGTGYTPSYGGTGAYAFAGTGGFSGPYFWTEADGSITRCDAHTYRERLAYYYWYHGVTTTYDSDGDYRTIGSQAKAPLPKNVVTDDGLTRTVGSAAVTPTTTPAVADDGLDKK